MGLNEIVATSYMADSQNDEANRELGSRLVYNVTSNLNQPACLQQLMNVTNLFPYWIFRFMSPCTKTDPPICIKSDPPCLTKIIQ